MGPDPGHWSARSPRSSQNAPRPRKGLAGWTSPWGPPHTCCTPGPRGACSPGPRTSQDPRLLVGRQPACLTMFLYWKKRGTYELGSLPGTLAELELGAVARFSWSSTLDIIEDLGGRSYIPSSYIYAGGCRRTSGLPTAASGQIPLT